MRTVLEERVLGPWERLLSTFHGNLLIRLCILDYIVCKVEILA